MKKVLFRICMITAILYFIMSSVYTIFYRGLIEESMYFVVEKIKDIPAEVTEITAQQQVESFYQGARIILNKNSKLLLASVIAGIIIGLVVSVKENSKARYILFVILGYGLYITILIGITIPLLGIEESKLYLRSIYQESMARIFLSYTILCVIVIICNRIRNKAKVKQLNETLKGEKINRRQWNFTYVKKISITLISIIVLLFVLNIVRKANILYKYSKAVEDLNQSTNYYIEEISENDTKEYYYKDGIMVEKLANGQISYYNEKTNELLVTYKNKAYIHIQENEAKPEPSIFFHYEGIRKRFWTSISQAFKFKIRTKKIEGTSYYVIEEYSTMYLNKETYLIESKVNSIISNQEEKQSITQYRYHINEVTEEQVAYPDLSQYEIYTNSEEFGKAIKQ